MDDNIKTLAIDRAKILFLKPKMDITELTALITKKVNYDPDEVNRYWRVTRNHLTSLINLTGG